MQIVRPIQVTPAMVTTSAVDADPPYVAGTTYAEGVKVTHERSIWLSLQAGNVGKTPGETASTEWWARLGPSNSWAMFDDEVGSVSSRAETLTATIEPVGAPVVALLNVRAKTVRCVSEHGINDIYDETLNLWDTAIITDWADYFFNEPEFRTEAIFDDLPALPGQKITVTISAPGSTAQCGMAVLGKTFDVGIEKLGLKRSGTDFSTVSFDVFGKATIMRRGYVRDVSTQTELKNEDFDRIARKLDQISSVPVLVLSGRPCFDSTVVYGLVSYTLDLALHRYSYASIDVKGLL